MEAPKVMNREIRYAVINPPNYQGSTSKNPSYRRRKTNDDDCDNCATNILCCCTILQCCELIR